MIDEDHREANDLRHGYSSVKYVPKPYREFRKGWWRCHGDKYLCFKNRRWSWDAVRAKNRDDLIKWIKDEDHEVTFVELYNKADYTD
jgi:hypothetical protein